MNYRFEELVNLTKVKKLLASHHGFSGMEYGLFDTNEDCLLAVGWQDICMQFHRVHPVTCARCRESDAYIKQHLQGVAGEFLEYRCKNGMVHLAMPILVDGRHLATFFTGQFFYEDDLPDRDFFVRQAEEFGFEQDAYLAALDRAPLFSREHIRNNMLFLQNVVELLAESGLANLQSKQEAEERMIAEETLLKRETELQQHTDFQNNLLTGLQNADVVFWLAEGGRITYCNNARFGEPFGLTEADMAAHPEFINLVHPDDRPRIAEIYRRRSAGEPMPTNFEVGMQWANGERREIEVVVSVVGYDPLKTLIIYKDITERKRMEEALVMREQEFRTLAENLPDNIVRYDREGRTLYLNPLLEKTLGITNADAVGTTVREFHPDGSFETYAQAVDAVINSGKDSEIEFIVPVPSKETVIHQIRIIAEHNEQGELIGALTIGRDITERKRYEMELLERAKLQEQLSAVAEAVPGFIYTARFEASGYHASFPYASPGIVELLGVRPEEIRDNPDALRNRYHPDDLSGFFEQIDESRRSGAPFRYEMRVLHPDKGPRWIEMRSTVQKLPDDTVVAHGVMIDITERKNTEARLYEMQSRLATIFATIPDLVWMKDTNGTYLACNQAFEQFFGATEAAIIGKTDYDFVGAELADFFRQKDREAMLVDAVCVNEEEITYAIDGRRGMLETRKVPVHGVNGEVIGVLGVARDITERKQLEDELRENEARYCANATLLHSILESSSDVIIFALDRNYRYLSFNTRHQEVMQAIWGRNIAVGSDMLELINTNEDRETAKQHFDRALAGEDFVSEDVYGDERLSRSYWQNIYSPIRSDAGDVIGLTCFVLNISARKQAEQELQVKNSELERFNYTVSHDLKSPVITIKSFSGAIKQDLGSGRYDRVEKDLDRICTAADKMAALLDDLLKLSRSGKTIDAPEPVDMAALVGSVLANLDGSLEENKVQVVVQPGLPTVMCDRQRMLEVLQNLIENAVKYRGGDQLEPRIEIGLRHDNGRQVFFVQDNGPGIEPKYHENIFGLFNRLETKIPGTGVGLALVKRIIEVHGGSVWVESDGRGNGSTFCFTVANYPPLYDQGKLKGSSPDKGRRGGVAFETNKEP